MVSKIKAGVSSVVTFVKSHPVAAVLFVLVAGAFVFPFLAAQLGKLKARGGVFGYIPAAFTK